jgi:hypothetical protein
MIDLKLYAQLNHFSINLRYAPTYPFRSRNGRSRSRLSLGPVTAAAVILPAYFENIILNDSAIIGKHREKLRPTIEDQAVTFAVTHLEP